MRMIVITIKNKNYENYENFINLSMFVFISPCFYLSTIDLLMLINNQTQKNENPYILHNLT